MRILALDPAEYRVGWALGLSGTKPAIGVYELREKDERTEEAIGRFGGWLYDNLLDVELLAVEHYLPSGALKGKTTADTRDGQVGLAYAARAVAFIRKVPYRSLYPQTIRKHFCGQATAGDRASTNAMVVKQAQLLGYIPKTCFDWDMASAAAVFDHASSYFGRKAAAFQLVGGKL